MGLQQATDSAGDFSDADFADVCEVCGTWNCTTQHATFSEGQKVQVMARDGKWHDAVVSKILTPKRLACRWVEGGLGFWANERDVKAV